MKLLKIGVFFGPLLLGGCFFKNADIKGNVFLTTEGGQSLKLGLVSVGVHTEANIQKAVQEAKRAFEKSLEEKKAKLVSFEKECKRMEEEQNKARDEVLKLREQITDLENKRPKNPRYYKSADTEVFTTTIKETAPFNIDPTTTPKTATEEREEKEKREQEVYELMAQQWRKEYDSVKGRLDEIESKTLVNEVFLQNCQNTLIEETTAIGTAWKKDFPETLFSNLPQPAIEAKTDADGDFLLPSPPRGKLAISARFTRAQSGKTEIFYWLFFIPKNLPKGGRILLNNENLLTSAYEGSVVNLNEPNK